MSVLIKGIDMPRSCAECRFLEGEAMDGLCHASEKWLDDDDYFLWFQYPEGDIDDSKPANCPLIEIPPHGRLIDADAKVTAMYYDEMTEEYKLRTVRIIQVLADCVDDSIPTVIEAEE